MMLLTNATKSSGVMSLHGSTFRRDSVVVVPG